ncbi:MAG: GTPase HflX [Verrucomicrobiae bacterium]|nr:GTPase HflX [Verrucomicrobiae bacterium]
MTVKALLDTAGRRTDRAFLIGVELKSRSSWDVRDSLDELAELARTAGAQVIGEGTQRLDAPHPATYIGAGKATEFSEQCRALAADTVLFDDELTPAQARNLEEIFGTKVLDRTGLILDIFAQRARTREGKLQVELAQLQYILPRLTRFWTHLSRQRGSTGSIGGEGESQLESDRRKTKERMEKLSGELVEVRRQRATQRAGRQRHQWPLASIVGYTNAGKSTLLNRLTGATVTAEDKLFATLDPTTRRLRLPTNQNVLLSDTVGFIRKLPHGLVESFKATLEEVVEAELLLHVVDAGHPHAGEQIRAVNAVLEEIGAANKPTLMVFNKVDHPAAAEGASRLMPQFHHAVAVSARSGAGIPDLQAQLGVMLRPVRATMRLSIPHDAAALIARLHAVGQVLERRYDGDRAWFRAQIPPYVAHEFAHYQVPEKAARPVGRKQRRTAPPSKKGSRNPSGEAARRR